MCYNTYCAMICNAIIVTVYYNFYGQRVERQWCQADPFFVDQLPALKAAKRPKPFLLDRSRMYAIINVTATHIGASK